MRMECAYPEREDFVAPESGLRMDLATRCGVSRRVMRILHLGGT